MEQEYLSIAELELLEQQELEGFRPEADANASLPPIPAGNYQAKITYANENEPDKIWVKKDKNKQGVPITPYYMAELRLETVGNGDEFDGRVLRFWASTMVMKNSGTTSIQSVLQPIGYGDRLMTMTKTARTQIALLNEALEGGQALIGVKVDWEAQIYDKEKGEHVFGPVRGMKKFPKDANGAYVPEIFKDLKGRETPNGEPVVPRNFIRGFVSLESLGSAVTTEPVEDAPQDDAPQETPAPTQSKPVAQSTAPKAATPPPAPSKATEAPVTRPTPRPTARPVPTRRG